MLRVFPNEEFKEIEFEIQPKLRYAVSNFGRILSFTDTIENGRILKGTIGDGYKNLKYTAPQASGKGKVTCISVYKLVAKYFIPKPSAEHEFVLHLDRNRSNDHYSNLKWATLAERQEHIKKSPFVIEAKKKLVEHKIRSNGPKLTETEVIFLKKRLLDPNRKTRIKVLAKQFKVSEMALYRIKSGENWGHIKVD